MTIIDRLLRPFRRKASGPTTPAPTKRDRNVPHSHSREIERNRRREAARAAKIGKDRP